LNKEYNKLNNDLVTLDTPQRSQNMHHGMYTEMVTGRSDIRGRPGLSQSLEPFDSQPTKILNEDDRNRLQHSSKRNSANDLTRTS